MCPEFERVERIVQLMVDGCEKVGLLCEHGGSGEDWLIGSCSDTKQISRWERPSVRRSHGEEVSAISGWLR